MLVMDLNLIEDQVFPSSGFGQNVLIFGVDMSSSAHSDNKKKDILVLRKGPTQGLEHTFTAEQMYSINFTLTKKEILFKFALQWRKQLFICEWYRNLKI